MTAFIEDKAVRIDKETQRVMLTVRVHGKKVRRLGGSSANDFESHLRAMPKRAAFELEKTRISPQVQKGDLSGGIVAKSMSQDLPGRAIISQECFLSVVHS